MATQQSMKKDIEILEKIQTIDTEIYNYKQVILGIPEELKAIDTALENERKTLKAFEEELRAVQLKQKQKESDLADKETAIKKYEGQLASVKTNKEYAAMQSEIAGLKGDNSILEEAIIGLFDQVEAAQKKLKAEQAKIAEVEKEANQKKELLQKKAGEAKQKAEELAVTKKTLIKEVNSEIAALYERIVEKKRGLALVKIDGVVCSACQIELRPQQINEVTMGEHIVTCEQCSRILYIE